MVVFLLQLYLSKLPHYTFKEDILYCCAKHKVHSSAWYEAIAVGKYSLGCFVKVMSKEAGLCLKSKSLAACN